MKKYNVAVVGATGLVGRTFLKVLAEYDFPMEMEVASIGTVEPQTNIGSMEVLASP
jgi:aspartate-semialdehyde dehydrogenase